MFSPSTKLRDEIPVSLLRARHRTYGQRRGSLGSFILGWGNNTRVLPPLPSSITMFVSDTFGTGDKTSIGLP